MNKNKKSLILIAVLTAVSLIAIGVLYMSKNKGTPVLITIDGEVYQRYDLYEDQVIEVRQGDEYNIIEIKDGEVNMLESTCENQICVYEYPISEDYPSLIVCLPHKLIVEIEGAEVK